MGSERQTPCLVEDLDEGSLNLVIELQISDIENHVSAWTGKQRPGEATDLENVHSQLFDRRMTQSIAAALRMDGRLVLQAAQEEEVAFGDRKLAHQLNGIDNTPAIKTPPQCLDADTLAKLAGMYVSESMGGESYAPDTYEDDNSDVAESSVWAARRPRSDVRKPDVQCEACRDPKKYFDVIAAPCHHNYCRDCLRGLFKASLTDESLFPPRCCHLPFTIDSVDIS